MLPAGKRWLVIAASSPAAATAFAKAAGVEAVLVLDGVGLVERWHGLRSMVRDRGIDAVLLHSTAWRREIYPQVFEAALALVPVRLRYLADEEGGRVSLITRAGIAGRNARIPVDMVVSAALVGGRLARLLPGRGRPASVQPAGTARSGPAAVLAIWGEVPSGSTGGAVTHLSGILGAYRRAGLRVGLVAVAPPPPQLRAVLDDLEIVDAPPAAARICHSVNEMVTDGRIERAGLRLAERLSPAFVYQRHSLFLTAGRAIAGDLGVPLVLEWNGSAVWAQAHWDNRASLERVFTPLAVSVERRIAAAADVVAAVSAPAAEMARQAGASPDRVAVVPNGVDVGEVRPDLADVGRSRDLRDHGSGPLLGWVGTFGPWHGADVLVRALSLLSPRIRLLMIGDGERQAECASLAASLGVADRVSWLGTLPHDAVLARLAACDILVSPTLPLPGVPFFGSPTKLFEYMALGRPIVASRLDQLAEVLEDGRNARLARPGDPEDLARAISDVLGSLDRGERLGRQARRDAVHRHTWDHRAAAILDRLGATVPLPAMTAGAPTPKEP
jgi:glycosyltransferase involved in cell wall biosynthesis